MTLRTWSTNFDKLSDFTDPGFYITPPGTTGATHTLNNKRLQMHKGWILAPDALDHRAYPTIQLYKLAGGGFRTPVITTYYVWVDAPPIPNGKWISLATISKTIDLPPLFEWDAIIANIGSVEDPLTKGCLYLYHVPSVGLGQWTFQRTDNPFPRKRWVKIELVVDFDPLAGYARIWQDGVLMSTAPVSGGHSIYEQSHFGLYAEATLSVARVYNAHLRIAQIGSLADGATVSS